MSNGGLMGNLKYLKSHSDKFDPSMMVRQAGKVHEKFFTRE